MGLHTRHPPAAYAGTKPGRGGNVLGVRPLEMRQAEGQALASVALGVRSC